MELWIHGDLLRFSSQHGTTSLAEATSDVLVLWLAGPASAILSSCEPSVPSHCTRLDGHCSYMYWKLLTLVCSRPCLHMRWVLPFWSGPFVMPVNIVNALLSQEKCWSSFFLGDLSCRNYVSKSYQDYNHLHKILLLDIIWLEVGKGFLASVRALPFQGWQGEVKLISRGNSEVTLM